MQNMTYARRQNHVVTIGFTLDLPEELADLDLGDRWVELVWKLSRNRVETKCKLGGDLIELSGN